MITKALKSHYMNYGILHLCSCVIDILSLFGKKFKLSLSSFVLISLRKKELIAFNVLVYIVVCVCLWF